MYDLGQLMSVFMLVQGPMRHSLPLGVLYRLVQFFFYPGLDPSLVQPWYLFHGFPRGHRTLNFHSYNFVIIDDRVGVEVLSTSDLVVAASHVFGTTMLSNRLGPPCFNVVLKVWRWPS